MFLWCGIVHNVFILYMYLLAVLHNESSNIILLVVMDYSFADFSGF